MRHKDFGKNQPDKKRNNQTSQTQYAKAPYNFIPLNDKLVPAEPIPYFDLYHSDRYTGYIELKIKALTPLYIRDTLNDKEFNEKLKNEEMRKRGEKLSPYANPDFFSPGDLPRIPGSSLRGMIRTLVEIVSFGKFENFDDRRLYYRSFADKCKRFRDEYRRHVKPNAGLLIKEGLKYYIIPTTCLKIPISKTHEILRKNFIKHKHFSYHSIEYEGKEAYLIISGEMRNKEHDYIVFESGDAGKVPLTSEDIDDYRRDKERRAGINLIEEVKKRGKVPCFYSEYTMPDGKRRVAFGHTLMFRIPYLKTIGDHIPQAIKVSSLDIPEAIFGNHKTHSSRVFFEDSYLVEGVYLSSEPLYPKILSSPKPTSFQHYLTQFPQNLSDFPKNLAHYNDPNPIRGYKLYWHREPEWEEKNKENLQKHKTQYTQIKPIQKDAIFRGRIRFENLSKVELGALLFVLNLPDNCAHKIGMGKPYGLGSIRIKPTLFLSDRQERYKDLFFEWDTPKETENTEEFIKEFENYILRNIGDNSKNSLWEHPRLRHLRCMLDFGKKPDKEKTAYMDMEKKEFKNRPVLKTPEDIYNEANDNRGR